MTEEELAESPVIRMAGSDGETYEATADMASEMAAAARDEGVELKPFLKTKDAEGNVHEISPFDDAALKEAQDRGDERHFEGNAEEDYFSADALKAGAARFAVGLVNPWDWIRGIGTAAGTVARGLAKGTVGTAIKALRGATYLGESITNAITGDDNHDLSDAIGKVDKGFDAVVDFLTPDLFKITGEYDGVEGAEEAAGKVRNVAEMVANLKGIGALTKGMAASEVAAAKAAGVIDTARAGAAAGRVAHTATGALFGLGKYGEVASDPNGPGGARQQAAALAAGAADAVIFGLWNPFKISAKHAAELKPFMEQTRKEVTKRVLLKLGQMAESGAAMATVEGVRQGAEQLAGIGQEGEGTWGDRSWEDSLKEIGSQFIVGSAFAAMEVVEGLPERVAHWRARRAQDPNGQMKVAMNYQVEKARKTLCPARHQQAVYAYSRFLKQGNRAESFKEGLSFGEDVRRVNEDGSVVFDDGSVWRLDPARNGATITISDGTILDAKTGDLLGYRARQESGERTGASPRTPEGADEGKAGTEARHSDERAASNAMVLLQQIDEGKLPIVQLDIAAIEGRAPTENGNEIGEWDPEKASPIVVLEDYEGNLRALTGGKRLVMAGASGAEKINAVVVKEADGWTAEMADGLGAIENMRQGNATLRNVVAACETLGAEQVQEIAGWHQAKGSQEFASKMRRGLSVAQKGGAELKAALAEGTVGEDFAYNAAQVLSMDRVGEGWETAQKALVDLAGRVGPEELDAVLWGLKRRLEEHGSASNVDWGAAIAEERAKYNAKNGAEEGKVDSDLVLIETGEGELKTLGEVEAGTEIAGAEANHPEGMAETAYAAAEGAAGNKAVELQAVSGREGVYTTLAFPDARLKVDGGAKTLGIDGLKIDDFSGANTERAAALVAKVEAFASENGLKIGFYDEDVMEAWRAMREQIKAEGEAAHARSEAEARRNTVLEQLQKSGLASEVVQSAEDFDRLFEELSGETLRSDEGVYGFVDPKTNKVYLNPAFFGTRQGLEVPIHEFGHLGVIAAEKVNKPVYDRGMKLATDFLEKPETAGEGPVRAIVDFILNDRVYSGQSREVQAQELLAQLIGKRGEEALRNEPNKSVVTKIKSWLVEFWNSFGKVLGLGEITPEQAAKMSLEDVADAIRAEMLSGRKYGESFAGVEFAGGGARTATRPRRLKRKLTGRRKAVNEFVREMGGGEDPTNRDVDLLALWVDNGGRLFDALPFEIDTHYSAGKAGVKKSASEELSRTAPTPLTARGTRYVALPLSEMNALARYLTGHATPAEMSTGRRLGVSGKASLKHRKIIIAADVLGTIDKTDLAAEKAMLKQHGFFANEDPAWTANHSPAEVRRERERSEEALSSRLEKLADRRTRGVEAGGLAAGRKVFADQLAKIVMEMPHGQPGVLGQMQTVGGALEKRVKGSDAEAEAFLDWMHGGPPQAARSVQERKYEMFAAFLMMPKEMEARAKGWYDAIRSTIAGDQKLADAFRKMTARSMTAQGFGHLQAEIVKMQDAQTEAAIKKLRAEGEAPIKTGSAKDAAKETIVLSCDDRMGAAMVRVDAKLRMYQEAQKLAMKLAKTPAEKALIKQQTDIFMGEIAQAKNQVELSRTAWERGHNNEDARYLWRMVDLLNEATERDGLRTLDLSLYLDQQRVIETKGLSGARGESTRQAQLILDAMRKRLGADFAKVEAFAAKFRAIHEQELLNDPVLERVLGKGTADYWRSQTHYVTTKRQFSPEELAEIEAARAAVRASGAAGGDDVVGEMFKFTQSAGKGSGEKMATAKLKGSFADKQEVMSATFEKVAAIKKFLRRSEYVIELRDLLLKAKVEGVHDYAAGKSEFPQNKRYGSISYMENGQRRTLVVPKEIADGFKAQGDYNNAALKLCGTVNNFARQLWIDWNPVYWQRNIGRNAGSIEMNMPGMKESVIKRGARFVFPGLAPVTEIVMTHLVRHLPEKMSLPLRKIWGEHTALFYAPKAKRMAMWLTDHNKMQQQLWEAEKRGDLGKVQQMLEDQRDMLDALKANMLVGGSAGKMGGTTGFLDDSVRTVGKTMMRERQEFAAKSKVRRALDAVNIFKKNAEQQVFEDVLAKFSAYLHDRAQFGTGNNRTAAESGLVVKKNVSIGEGERKGQATRTTQALFQPFWNMVEKGVVRNVKAYGDRPGETFQKAAWRIAPMILHGLVGSGAIAAWILKSNDGDEEKAKSGPMGDIYRYARDMQRAYQNCSNYVRENYHVTPLMTDGYTSIVLGMPLTDEERLLKPIAQFVTDVASVAAGTKESLDVAKSVFDATAGVIAPDFKLAGALPTLLDDTVHALWENPKDYYTGGQKYDNDLWLLRNDSWGMRGKFLAAMGKRLWNDFGGRNVLPVDRAGVDNGLGRAPGWVSRMVNDIPVLSPILRSFIKVQVGSPKRDADEIVEADNRRRAACRIHAKELFEMARREKRDISMDRERYEGLLQKWQQSSERLSDEDLAYIESHYINAWNAYEGAQYRADGEREKYRATAEKLGLDAAHLWLDFD